MHEPDVVLRDFMREMNSWEKRCAVRLEECIAGKLDFDEAESIGSSEYLQIIFSRYCSTSKAQPRDFHFTEPPDYDPEGEGIVTTKVLSQSLVELFTHQNYGHRKRHIFRLVLENKEWKIIERKILLDNGDSIDASI